MKITEEYLGISASQKIPWKEIKKLRQVNDKLQVVLDDDEVVECTPIDQSWVDLAFRAFEDYLRKHPHPHKT